MESSYPQHGRTRLGDSFNEDVTELQFLKSKPTCFVIFGKPGSGKSTLAKRLSQLWRCELIHATDMILREIDLGSEIGKKMQEVLMKGEALSTDFIVQLLKEKAASPEVAHYGYVLDDLPCQAEEAATVHQQLEIVRSFKLNPDFIINIKIPDHDLNTRRVGTRVDPVTGDLFLRDMWDESFKKPAVKDAAKSNQEEEEEEEEEEGEEENAEEAANLEVDKEAIERLVHAPENQQIQVEQASANYKDNSLKLLEEYMADHDRQYLIELDGNFPPETMFQQLMSKLDTYTVRRAIAPIRLQSLEEEELPDEIETDELLRTLAAYQMPAPRHRWRRSKWGRLCPVALKDGKMLQGKPDLAVSFLDKMYVMSSPEAMGRFLKNPRPFLLPPLPKPPCKMSVIGLPLSGKTSLCKSLAQVYNARVFDVKTLMEPKFIEAKAAAIEKAKQEALESGINMVQNKLEQEALERADARRKEAEEEAEKDAANTDADAIAPSEDAVESTSLVPTDESVAESNDRTVVSPVPKVTEDHEEVRRIIADAVKVAEKQEIKLQPDVYVSVIKSAIDEMLAKRQEEDPDSPPDGGWILDNFPENKDHWGAMLDAGVVPDEVIVLNDRGSGFETTRTRYFELNEKEVIENYRARLILDKQNQIKNEEEMLKPLQELEEKSEKTSEEDLQDTDAKMESSPDLVEPPKALNEEILAKISALQEELVALETKELDPPPPDSVEYNKFRDALRFFDKEWGMLQAAIGGSSNKSIELDIQTLPVEEICHLATQRVESAYGYRAWDFSGTDLDEEEEDAGADLEGNDEAEEEEEEDEEASKQKKKQFGYSKHFDPVALKDDFVLWPGNSDIAAKYRERVYYFKSTENREQFVEEPMKYLPVDKPLKSPPPRILILGARGSGKTLQGRNIASQLGLFHISFRERLQEIILPKTNRKLGPEHEEQKLLDKEFSVSIEEAVRKATSSEESDVTVNEEEEEEKFDLNDEEDAIRLNLVDDEALPDEILNHIVPKWWKEEPYRSTGFVLEGFPRTPEECQYLMINGLFPDVALMLMVEDTDVVKRLLPFRMEKWIKRRDFREEKKRKIKEKKQQIRNEKIELRRTELLNEQAEKKRSRQSDMDEEEEDEDEEEEDIEEILLNEFEEEEEEEEEEEQEEDARDRIKSEFGEIFDDDVSKLQSLQEQLEECSIPRLEVQGSRKPSIVKYLIDGKLKPIVSCRDSLFERPYPVSEVIASKLLLSGYKHPSSFSKWDPVKLLDEGDVIQPLHSLTNPSYPIVYNQHVYYLSSFETRNAFMANPIRYVFNQPLAKPVVPIQISIVGPPKSGKTTLAERFCKEFGTLRISAGSSIRNVLEKQPDTILATQILSHLHQGGVVPDVLTVEAIATTMMDTTCSTRGYVLDGYPCVFEQVNLLKQRGILPVKIIELSIDEKEVISRAHNDLPAEELLELPRHNSEEMTIVKYNCFIEKIPAIRDWYQQHHHNWITINAKISKWKLWQMIHTQSNNSVKLIQDYLDRTARGEAARLADLCISPSEFESHIGPYDHYCPVSLNDRGELMDCSSDQFLEFAVEFRSKYYKTSSREDMDAFLENPEKFTPPNAEKQLPPPELLPKRRTRLDVKAMFPKQIELNGYCPVTYVDGKLRFDALVEGDNELVAEYKSKLYVFEDEEKLSKFMKTPDVYSDLKLPHKLPPKKEPMNVVGLPMLGYMEQGAANSIIKALTAVGCFKPKFPFISVRRSCLIYIACHLKAFNPKNSPFIRQKYGKKLRDFEEMCQVITYLGSHMTKRYPEPSRRPIDFDHKMSIFLKSEENAPSRDWVKQY